VSGSSRAAHDWSASLTAPTRFTVDLRWRDLDVMGHVWSGRYHEFLDESRAAVFAPITGPLGFPFVLARVEMDHRHELVRADGHVVVESAILAMGRSSVVVGHRIRRPDDEIAAEGASTMVAFDLERRVARPIADDERRLLLAGGAPSA